MEVARTCTNRWCNSFKLYVSFSYGMQEQQPPPLNQNLKKIIINVQPFPFFFVSITYPESIFATLLPLKTFRNLISRHFITPFSNHAHILSESQIFRNWYVDRYLKQLLLCCKNSMI